MGGQGGSEGADHEGEVGGPLTAGPLLLIEHGWQPSREPATFAEQHVADLVRAMLPRFRMLLWNVRNDLPPVTMGEILAQRMRTGATAHDWRETLALEEAVAAVRAG